MTNFPSSRRWLCLLAALIATAIVAGSSVPANAATPTTQDPVKQRENVRKQQKAISGEINTLKATDAQLAKQLAQLDANVKQSKSEFDRAAAAAANAARAAGLARDGEASATANFNRLRKATKSLAIDLYMHGFSNADAPKLNPQQLAEAATHGYLGVLAVQRGDDVTKRLGALRDEMVKQREAAEASAALAASERAKQQAALASLQNNRSKQARLATEVERRLEAALAESAALAAIDKQLSKAIAARSKGSGAGGRIAVGNVDVTTVHGITVAKSIASKVDALMTKAKADGIALGGYGYRNSSQQVALRKAHCGPTDYDIYEKPSNQCHPPTARPGASMHERGLAIDFTYQGSIITSKSNPAFKWLSANAKNYGLYNLPSEPWHWSTNGN